MRFLIALLCLFPLAGCGLGTGAAMGVGVGANVLALTTIHRTIPDAVISLVTGKDCSMVRLDNNKSYCRRKHALPPPLPYCTQTLGQATCWADPSQLPDHAPQVAEGPYELSPSQIVNRDRRWP
ncbi:MAG: hypothetical protein PHT60_07880 [Acidiphilium sp.]|nr:hypothetical protein [Acidiphilium sp.]MDD4935681.1 hypothetical protein [Acidiphilium sp.]